MVVVLVQQQSMKLATLMHAQWTVLWDGVRGQLVPRYVGLAHEVAQIMSQDILPMEARHANMKLRIRLATHMLAAAKTNILETQTLEVVTWSTWIGTM